MKVLILGPFPPPVYGVSLSNFVLNNGLLKRGIKVSIINTAGGKKIDSEVGAWDVQKLSFIKSYLGLFKIFNVDVVYCTSGQTFFGIVKYAPFIILARIFKKKTIIHVKGGYLKQSYDEMNKFKKIITKKVLSNYSSGIVLSKSLKYLLENFLPDEKIFIQHNFIQDSLIVSEDVILKVKEHHELRIIFLSNLMKEKGIEELLAALKSLNDSSVLFKAKIAGNIPKNDSDLLQTMTQMKNVEYVGVVENEAKTELLSWGNVFCLPTYYSMEGQPISILEAMGFGNVILTTKHAGIPDVCTKENGVFVEKENVSSIVTELEYLSNNLLWVKETGVFNMRQARKLYTEDAFVDGIVKIMKHS